MVRARQTKLFAVVMAGGSGTRFWPLSRRARPKQLLSIASRRTMLQDTVARLAPLVPAQRTLVVTGRQHAEAVRRQLPRLPAANILVEPTGRNTAPCIALASEWIDRREPDSTMVVVPADHAIANARAFRRTVSRAVNVAVGTGALVTLGIRPSYAETGYGYIKLGPVLDRCKPAAFRVERFREKPPAAQARRFIGSGHYLWNTGIFVWQTAVIRAMLRRHVSGIVEVVGKLGADLRPSRSMYEKLPAVSIDVAVMEPTATIGGSPLVAVVAAEFDWSDVGSWAALAGLWGRDGDGNAIRGKVIVAETTRTTVLGSRRLVAVLGVSDLVVVDAPDALLVCSVRRAQDVRVIVSELQRRGWREFL
jgi:mannose-1-phosphate guanylyltransferase